MPSVSAQSETNLCVPFASGSKRVVLGSGFRGCVLCVCTCRFLIESVQASRLGAHLCQQIVDSSSASLPHWQAGRHCDAVPVVLADRLPIVLRATVPFCQTFSGPFCRPLVPVVPDISGFCDLLCQCRSCARCFQDLFVAHLCQCAVYAGHFEACSVAHLCSCASCVNILSHH